MASESAGELRLDFFARVEDRFPGYGLNQPSFFMIDHPLPAIRNQLLSLHKLLMNAERAAYEQEGGVIRSPLHFLQLLTEHERFAWLRQLSQLVVMMDEAMEEKPQMVRERADTLVEEARHLLTGSEEPTSFAQRYAALRSRAEAVNQAHEALAQILMLPNDWP
jgi:hypothetical protein